MKQRKPHLPPGTKWMLRKITGHPQALWLELFGWSVEWGASPSHCCPFFNSGNLSEVFHWALYTRFASDEAGSDRCVLEEVVLGDDGRYIATGRTRPSLKPPPKLGAREAGRRALDLLERISITEWAAEAAFRGAPEMVDLVQLMREVSPQKLPVYDAAKLPP